MHVTCVISYFMTRHKEIHTFQSYESLPSNKKHRKVKEAVLTGVYSAVLGQSFWGKLTRFMGCVN